MARYQITEDTQWTITTGDNMFIDTGPVEGDQPDEPDGNYDNEMFRYNHTAPNGGWGPRGNPMTNLITEPRDTPLEHVIRHRLLSDAGFREDARRLVEINDRLRLLNERDGVAERRLARLCQERTDLLTINFLLHMEYYDTDEIYEDPDDPMYQCD